jgi:hypothetical protein
MVHEWLRRYAPDGGLAYLVDRSSRPREFGDKAIHAQGAPYT